jgi:hypothetical protein
MPWLDEADTVLACLGHHLWLLPPSTGGRGLGAEARTAWEAEALKEVIWRAVLLVLNRRVAGQREGANPDLKEARRWRRGEAVIGRTACITPGPIGRPNNAGPSITALPGRRGALVLLGNAPPRGSEKSPDVTGE